MNKLFYILAITLSLSFITSKSEAQRIVIYETFENSGFNADSLPTGWFKVDADGTGATNVIWGVRDTGTSYQGSAVVKSQAYNSVRALTDAWPAGNPEVDDWAFTDTFTVVADDSLIFWMYLGSSGGDFQDSMQVHACSDQDPVLSIEKLATIKSEADTNYWREYKFNLSAFATQKICIAFRYYESTLGTQGYWINVDNVFIGNRGSIGITQNGTNIPDKFALNQNYPNPFNPTTKINFDIPTASNVKLTVFNSIGQIVMNIFEGFKPAGSYQAEFNGSSLSSGTYYYRLETESFVETKKMQLVK